MEETTGNGARRNERRELAKMFAIGTLASLVGVALVLVIDWFPAQASTAADDIDTLWDVLLIVSVPIFVLVMTVSIYSVLRFRARPGQRGDGPPIHGSTRLEIIWVTIPFIIVTALAIYGWIVLDDIEEAQQNELVVDVTGRQFAWHFSYPDGEVQANELVLPVGRPARLDIRTDDVIHSFWVPEFRLKQDAVAGITTRVRLTPDRTGRWQVVCAELCGLGHATMRQTVRVVGEDEFETWLAGRKRESGAARAESGNGPDVQ